MTPAPLAALFRGHPEWAPWLRVLEGALQAAGEEAWTAAVPPLDEAGAGPRLAGATLAVDDAVGARLVRDLARRAGVRDAAALGARALAVLEAAINQDITRLEALAADAGADTGTVHAIAPAIALPLLLACGQAWAGRTRADWAHGYCPTCGAWPALAEARGLERSRQLRCGRCGGDWPTQWLRCPYCGMAEHVRLGSLVPTEGGESRKVDICLACGAYVKTLTVLTACPPAEVALRDLESVDLDLAALERGYQRPPGPGRPLGVRLVAHARPGRLRRLFASA